MAVGSLTARFGQYGRVLAENDFVKNPRSSDSLVNFHTGYHAGAGYAGMDEKRLDGVVGREYVPDPSAQRVA